MFVFDYIFYKFYLLYKKKEGSMALSSATSAITFIQIVSICSGVLTFFIVFNRISTLEYPKNKHAVIIVSIIVFSITLDILNYLRFKKKLQTILRRYQKHRFNKWFKNWMLVIPFVALPVFPFIVRWIIRL